MSSSMNALLSRGVRPAGQPGGGPVNIDPAAAGAADTGSNAWQALGAVSGVAAGLGSIMGGYSQAAQLKGQAAYSKFGARQALIRGSAEAAEAARVTNADMAAFNVGLGAAGISPTDSAIVAADSLMEQGERAETGLLRNAQAESARLRRQAKILRQQAKSAVATGWISGITNIGMSVARAFTGGMG